MASGADFVEADTGPCMRKGHGRAKWPDATVLQARGLYAEGLSCRAVDKALGVPWPTVVNWVRLGIRRDLA